MARSRTNANRVCDIHVHVDVPNRLSLVPRHVLAPAESPRPAAISSGWTAGPRFADRRRALLEVFIIIPVSVDRPRFLEIVFIQIHE
jgi:hypothetical protein